MAFMSIISPCGACGTVIAYNPDLVPSLHISGEKRAICPACVETWNKIHSKQPDFTIPEGAYEPQEVA